MIGDKMKTQLSHVQGSVRMGLMEWIPDGAYFQANRQLLSRINRTFAILAPFLFLAAVGLFFTEVTYLLTKSLQDSQIERSCQPFFPEFTSLHHHFVGLWAAIPIFFYLAIGVSFRCYPSRRKLIVVFICLLVVLPLQGVSLGINLWFLDQLHDGDYVCRNCTADVQLLDCLQCQRICEDTSQICGFPALLQMVLIPICMGLTLLHLFLYFWLLRSQFSRGPEI